MLSIIAEHPGIHHRGLQRLSGLPYSTVAYHVRCLVADGQVHLRREGRFILLYPTREAAQRASLANRLLLRGHAFSIYQTLLRARRGLTQEQIRSLTGLSVQLISYHLRKLVDAGILTSDDASPRRYTIAPAKRR